MKKNMILAGMAMMLSTPVFADTIGVYLGASAWDSSASGTLGETTGQVDLGLQGDAQTNLFIAFEHPLPLIPNIRIAQSSLDTDGSSQLDTDFEFGGETYNENNILDTSFEVSYTDYTLYYELFDNGLFSFDLGITARDFDSDITVSHSVTSGEGDDTITKSSTLSASEFVPMLYVAANVGLPFTGFNFYAQGNLLSISDSTLYDYEAGISYELVDNLAVDVNLTAGYKAVKLELDDIDDLYTGLDFDGVYAGVVVHF